MIGRAVGPNRSLPHEHCRSHPRYRRRRLHRRLGRRRLGPARPAAGRLRSLRGSAAAAPAAERRTGERRQVVEGRSDGHGGGRARGRRQRRDGDHSPGGAAGAVLQGRSRAGRARQCGRPRQRLRGRPQAGREAPRLRQLDRRAAGRRRQPIKRICMASTRPPTKASPASMPRTGASPASACGRTRSMAPAATRD